MIELGDVLAQFVQDPAIQKALVGIVVLFSLIQSVLNLTWGTEVLDSEATKDAIRKAQAKWNPLAVAIIHAASQWAAWRAGNNVNVWPRFKKNRRNALGSKRIVCSQCRKILRASTGSGCAQWHVIRKPSGDPKTLCNDCYKAWLNEGGV